MTSCDRDCSHPATDADEYAELFDAESWTYTRLCEQVDADAASTITI